MSPSSTIIRAKLWQAVARCCFLTNLMELCKTGMCQTNESKPGKRSALAVVSYPFFAIDLETTGMRAAFGERVIEIGLVGIQNGTFVSEFQQLIRTSRRIARAATRVHGITKEMIEDQPGPEAVFARLREMIGDQVLISHNARFDGRFLRQEFARLGRTFSNRWICTLKLARDRLPGLCNYRLQTVAAHLLGELPSNLRLHRALDDARLTARMWLALEGYRTKLG